MHQIESSFTIDSDIDTVWKFFSNPQNLLELTPDDMAMEPAHEIPAQMREGMLVSYKVRPIAGIPILWTSKITGLKKHTAFEDHQVKGPFSYWHHRHEFEAVGQKTIVRDILQYKLPGGVLGKLFNKLIVRSKLSKLFKQREALLKEALED